MLNKIDSNIAQINFSRLQLEFFNQKIPKELYIEFSEYESEPLVSQKFSEVASKDIVKIKLLNSDFEDINSIQFNAKLEFFAKNGYNISAQGSRYFCMHQTDDNISSK